MFGFKKAQKPAPVVRILDRETYDAFIVGRLSPQTDTEAQWFEDVKAGRIEATYSGIE